MFSKISPAQSDNGLHQDSTLVPKKWMLYEITYWIPETIHRQFQIMTALLVTMAINNQYDREDIARATSFHLGEIYLSTQ